MKIRIPDYYNDFSCQAGECKDPCCKAGWQIIIDDETLCFYNETEGEFAEKFNKHIQHNDGENMFCADNGVCKFLREDGLCEIQCEFGAERLCTTCKNFPRYNYVYGGLREAGLELSCPEAARLIITKKDKINFLVYETREMPEPNDLDADLFNYIIKCRDKSIEIVQNKTKSLDDRILTLLEFNKAVEKNLKRKNYSQIDNDISIKSDLLSLKKSQIKKLSKLERLIDKWGEVLSSFIDKKYDVTFTGYENEFENILVYFIFRYYLDAVYDRKVLNKIIFSVFSVMMIKYTFDKTNDLISSAKLYSREIEHSDENVDALVKSLNVKSII